MHYDEFSIFLNKTSVYALVKCNYLPFRENYDRPTNQQTDQQMDIRGHRDVTLPIMIVVKALF